MLTTDFEAGPVGIKGAQYHAAGQSFMDRRRVVGTYHTNESVKPVKYLMLHLGYPVTPTRVQKAEPQWTPRHPSSRRCQRSG